MIITSDSVISTIIETIAPIEKVAYQGGFNHMQIGAAKRTAITSLIKRFILRCPAVNHIQQLAKAGYIPVRLCLTRIVWAGDVLAVLHAFGGHCLVGLCGTACAFSRARFQIAFALQ